jgi:hypothetical protein
MICLKIFFDQSQLNRGGARYSIAPPPSGKCVDKLDRDLRYCRGKEQHASNNYKDEDYAIFIPYDKTNARKCAGRDVRKDNSSRQYPVHVAPRVFTGGALSPFRPPGESRLMSLSVLATVQSTVAGGMARFEGNATEPPRPALPGMLSRILGLRTLLLMEELAHRLALG